MKQQPDELEDQNILVLTKEGKRELSEAGTKLTPAQLEALVLVDGFSTVAQLVKHARSLAPNGLRGRLKELIDRGLLSKAAQVDDILDPGDFFTKTTTHTDVKGLGEQVYAEADSSTEFLRKNGYCVNMARLPAVKRERPEGRKPMVLVIDDDPDICKLLQTFLKLENIDSRTAANREEIVAALRRTPLPDMVLLDVHLADVNGFDVLARMRQHPVLKDLPIVMLTVEANRDAVLRGIAGGADGYITKPFEIHPLLRAVKTVLGIKFDSPIQDWDYSH